MEERTKKISDKKLTELFKSLAQEKGIFIKGKQFKVKFVRQIKTSPPSFLIFCNLDATKKVNIRRYVENNIRKEFDFTGAPIFLKFKY
jgi:GTP-binding protein